MANTVRELQQILMVMNRATCSFVHEYVFNMPEEEFNIVPTIFVTQDARKVLDIYASVVSVKVKEELVSLYLIGSQFFKVIS